MPGKPTRGWIDEQVPSLGNAGKHNDDLFNRNFDQLQKYLEFVTRDANKYNLQLLEFIRQRVEERRRRLEDDRGLADSLGFRIRRRTNLPGALHPKTVRRKLLPTLPAAKAGERHDPVLELAEYEHILKVVGDMALVIERSPRAFQHMREEDLRMHFLVQLNGHYEGQATGETFNFQGKTDVLIRVGDRNVFCR